MCNVFKYNNYYPDEYIPIDPQKYIENNNIGDNSSANSEKFRKYVEYLTSTYKSNIYKINSYIRTVNKMVDKIVAICDYIVYDNDNTIVQGADINYNIIYDKYQRIDLDDNNHALLDSSLGDTTNNKSFQDLINNDFGDGYNVNTGLAPGESYE
jgi:esterase/lipase